MYWYNVGVVTSLCIVPYGQAAHSYRFLAAPPPDKTPTKNQACFALLFARYISLSLSYPHGQLLLYIK